MRAQVHEAVWMEGAVVGVVGGQHQLQEVDGQSIALARCDDVLRSGEIR